MFRCRSQRSGIPRDTISDGSPGVESASRLRDGFETRRTHVTGNRLSRRTARSLLIGAAALTTVLAYTTPGAAAPRAVSSGPSASATHAPSALAAVTAAPRLQRGTRVLGALAASTPVTGAVALRLPDPGAVTRFIDDVSNSRSPSFHHYLGRGQFAADFGPRPAVVEAVRHQLSTDGLRVTGVSANHLFVSFSGTAATTEAAFHTGLVRVRLANGAAGQATTAAVRVPGTIARDVQAVIGLDQLVRESNGLEHPGRIHHGVTSSATVPHTSDGGPVACGNALAQQANGALTDQQVATSYGVDPLYGAGDLASGQTIDVYELEPFLTSDLQGFEECYFGADHTSQLTVSSVDGGPGTGPGSGEAALDVEDVAALAPGADIHVFSGPNMDNPFGPLDTWNAIAIADDAGQITSSWGVCETALQEGAPGVEQVENEIFEQTAAQGQTVFSAAGDDGSDDCAAHASSPVAANLSLDDPSSQPYVTSVGGTTILNATEPPVETVWNNGDDGGAGGGGISELWAMQQRPERHRGQFPRCRDRHHLAVRDALSRDARRERARRPPDGHHDRVGRAMVPDRGDVVVDTDVGRHARRDQRVERLQRARARCWLRRPAAVPDRRLVGAELRRGVQRRDLGQQRQPRRRRRGRLAGGGRLRPRVGARHATGDRLGRDAGTRRTALHPRRGN
jgi:hypothetical protein